MNADVLHGALHLAGTMLVHWAALVGVLSVIVHARVSWRETAMGRHLMAYMTAIAAVLVLVVIANDIGDSVYFQLLRMIVFAAVPIAMTQRLVLQIRAQREVRRSDDVSPEP